MADIPCGRCTTSRCCTYFDPELTGPDVHRIIGALQLQLSEFAVLTPVRADLAGPDGIRFGGDETWELRLARTPTPRGEGADRRCVFLMHLGPGLNRCGIYQERPMICRTYPTDLTRFGLMVGNPPDICPPGAWAQERTDLRHFAAIHATASAERTRWRAFLARWNRDPWQSRAAAVPRAEALARWLELSRACEDAAIAGADVDICFELHAQRLFPA